MSHTYDCEVCGYTGEGEETMEDHILDKHAQPDSDNIFKCDDCSFQSKEKEDFGKHYKEKHGSKANQTSKNESIEKTKMESELKQLKNNFERLEAMYNEALEEANNVKSEYEAKLIRGMITSLSHWLIMKF